MSEDLSIPNTPGQIMFATRKTSPPESAGAHHLTDHRPDGTAIPRSLALLLAAFLLPVSFTLRAQTTESFDLGDGPVAVYNLVGSVQVEGTSGSEVRVEVERRGSDAERLEVEIDRIGGREALRVRYPSDRIVFSEARGSLDTRVSVADDGTFFDDDDGVGDWLSRVLRDDRVRILSSGRGLEAWAHVRVLVPEGTDVATYLAAGATRVDGVVGDVRVETGQGRIDARGTRGSLSLDTGSGDVTVMDAEGDLLVDTGSGSVDASDVSGPRLEMDTGSGSVRLTRATGAILVDTGSGSVDLSDVSGSNLEVDTGSGSVDGEGIAVESVWIDTGSGGVRLDRVSARSVEVDTGSGRVSLETLDDSRSIAIDTGSGGVDLVLGGRVGDVWVDTGSGSVDIAVAPTTGARVILDAGGRTDVASGLPFEVLEERRDYLEGRLGDGAGRIHVDTGSGGVRIRES